MGTRVYAVGGGEFKFKHLAVGIHMHGSCVDVKDTLRKSVRSFHSVGIEQELSSLRASTFPSFTVWPAQLLLCYALLCCCGFQVTLASFNR